MAANVSEVDICNKALARLGANLVESSTDRVDAITTDSIEAKLCKQLYPMVRDMVTEDRIWSFALERVTLTPDNQAPAFGFSNRFLVPIEVLSIWRVNWPESTHLSSREAYTRDWILEGRYILSDAAELNVQYIKRLSHQDIYYASTLFVDILSIRLAMEMCITLTESNPLLQHLTNEYEMRVVEASAKDGSQASHELIRANSLRLSRHG